MGRTTEKSSSETIRSSRHYQWQAQYLRRKARLEGEQGQHPLLSEAGKQRAVALWCPGCRRKNSLGRYLDITDPFTGVRFQGRLCRRCGFYTWATNEQLADAYNQWLLNPQDPEAAWGSFWRELSSCVG